MKHFSIVHAICRLSIGQPSDALLFQLERLAKAVEDDGDAADAASLRALALVSERSAEMTPRKLLPSKGFSIPGEVLQPNTILPSDKETGIRLVETIFPGALSDTLPAFSPELERATAQLVAEWHNINALTAAGLTPTMSCLIVGQPGTGKTTLAYWLAKQLDLPIVLARIDAMMSSFLGTSARNITQVFNFANRFKCILVLDEFDSLAKMRDDPNEIGEIKRVVNALLQNLDSRKASGITIGVTNHPKLLDSAVWRRFEAQIHVPLPSFAARKKIVARYAEPMTLSEPEMLMLAGVLEDCSGAEVEDFIRAYKKRYAIGPRPSSPLEALKDIATLNSDRISALTRSYLEDEVKFVGWLKKNEYFSLGVVDVAALIGKGKSTVSRLKNKVK